MDKLRAGFAAIGDAFGHGAGSCTTAADRMRVVLVVSKFGHCLNDLLFRSASARCRSRSPAVVSNHTDFAELAAATTSPSTTCR